MTTVWALVMILLGLLAWGGQAFSWLTPDTAARLSLTENRRSVEPVFWADIRAEALWDSVTLWALPLAGLLLLLDHDAWSYFGLIGGGIYLYFSGRGILARLEMRRSGFRIGEPGNVRMALIMLAVWGVVGLVTIVAAYNTLNGG